MTKIIETGEATAELVQLLALTKAGEEVIFTQSGTPVAKLSGIAVGVAASTPRVAGLHAGAVWVSDDFDAPLPDDFWTAAS